MSRVRKLEMDQIKKKYFENISENHNVYV